MDVQITNFPGSSRPVLVGGTPSVNGGQRDMVRQQVEDLVIGDLRGRGLFPQIEAKRHAWRYRDLQRGDYVFTVIFDFPWHFQAQLYEASEMQQIMQDGPPSPWYVELHPPGPAGPDCGFYKMDTFTIDRDLAYVSRGFILGTLLRSYEKMATSVKAYDSGVRDHFPYLLECCYCQEP